eukprot:13044578-Alexandrium_andersonii.AAC.1
MDLPNTIAQVFHRQCNFTWQSYFHIGAESEMNEEIAWAEARPGVQKRKAAEAAGADKVGPVPGNIVGRFWEALTTKEQERLLEYVRRYGGELADLNQNP